MSNPPIPPQVPKPPVVGAVAPAGAAPVAGKSVAPPPMPAPARQVAGPVDPNQLPPEQPEIGVPLTFWQQPWVQNILPFITSVTVHALILLIGVVFFLGAKYVASIVPHQEEVVVPDASMINDGPPGGVPFQGLGQDPNRQAFQDKVKDVKDPQWADKPGKNLEVSAPGGAEGDSTDNIIALGPGGNFGKGAHGNGAGVGEGLGSGNGEGGPLAAFGQPGGGGIGPKGPMFGHGGNARKIAFVCDASGSMLNKFSVLKAQLSKTVQDLLPVQSFNIIFFQEQSASFLSPGLVMATPENKIKASNFLADVTPRGETNPIPGIEQAFKDKPQLIYILTDGDFPDNDAVLKKIRDLNKGGTVKINTIAFVGDADKDTAFMELLQTIAKENKGVYKFVRESDLQ